MITSFVPNVSNDFKSFLINNNVLTVMAAVTIAFSTGTMIRSLVIDIILPSFYSLLISRVGVLDNAFAPISKLNLDSFIKEIVTWIFVIIFTFILIEYVIRRMMLKMYPVPASPSSAPAPAKKDSSNDAAGAIVTEQFYYRL